MHDSGLLYSCCSLRLRERSAQLGRVLSTNDTQTTWPGPRVSSHIRASVFQQSEGRNDWPLHSFALDLFLAPVLNTGITVLFNLWRLNFETTFCSIQDLLSLWFVLKHLLKNYIPKLALSFGSSGQKKSSKSWSFGGNLFHWSHRHHDPNTFSSNFAPTRASVHKY